MIVAVCTITSTVKEFRPSFLPRLDHLNKETEDKYYPW